MGWLVDGFSLRKLVKQANKVASRSSLAAQLQRECEIGLAYVLWLPPFGIFGAHHFYTGDVRKGFLYLLTFGLLGGGWATDFAKIPQLVQRANSTGEAISRQSNT